MKPFQLTLNFSGSKKISSVISAASQQSQGLCAFKCNELPIPILFSYQHLANFRSSKSGGLLHSKFITFITQFEWLTKQIPTFEPILLLHWSNHQVARQSNMCELKEWSQPINFITFRHLDYHKMSMTKFGKIFQIWQLGRGHRWGRSQRPLRADQVRRARRQLQEPAVLQ